jgi:hypothetical protein
MFQTISNAVKSRRGFLSTSLLSIGLVLAIGEPVLPPKRRAKNRYVSCLSLADAATTTFQTQALKEAVAKLAQAEWTVVNEGGAGTKAQISLYDNPDWSKALTWWCTMNASPTPDHEYIRKITQAHGQVCRTEVIHLRHVSGDRHDDDAIPRSHKPAARSPSRYQSEKPSWSIPSSKACLTNG